MRQQNELKETKISVIIPTLNEANNVGKLVQHLLRHRNSLLAEVIVVDGGSLDNTVEVAQAAGAEVVVCKRCGRSHQMNVGSRKAKGTILYFVHCDTLPPVTYLTDILNALKGGFSIGCFQATFDSNRPLVKLNGFFSRFDALFCRGGDQTLFVTKLLFEQLNGYKESLLIMEEYDFIIRARKKHTFKIIPSKVLVSARKYEDRSYLKVQFANLVVFNMFRFGVSQERLIQTYRKLLG